MRFCFKQRYCCYIDSYSNGNCLRCIKPIKLLLPLVAGATIGADISIIGSPGNLIAKNTIEEFSNGTMTVGFFEYAKIGIPMLIAVAVVYYLVGDKLIADRDAGDNVSDNHLKILFGKTQAL